MQNQRKLSPQVCVRLCLTCTQTSKIGTGHHPDWLTLEVAAQEVLQKTFPGYLNNMLH